MMGHTQGVKRARSPPANPIRKIYNHERLLSLSLLNCLSSSMTGSQSAVPIFDEPMAAIDAVSANAVESFVGMSALLTTVSSSFSGVSAVSCGCSSFFLFWALSFAPSPWKLNSTWVGGMQVRSLQAPYSRNPLISYFSPVILYCCTKVTLFSK